MTYLSIEHIMGTYKKTETLNMLASWLYETQRGISKIGQKLENVFEEELQTGDGEISGLLNGMSELYSMIESLEDSSTEIVKRYESD